MLPLLYVSFWILPAVARANISSFYVEEQDKDVSYCVRDIVGEIIENDQFIIDVILLNMDDAVQIHELHGMKKARFISRSFSWLKSKVYQRVYVTSAADLAEFKNTMIEAMKDVYFNPYANFIIFLKNFKYYHHKEMVTFLVVHNIYNVTILAKDYEKDGYGIYTLHSPIHPCNQRERIIKISDCISCKGSQIFPKIEAIRGCSFSLVTHNIFPLINLDKPDEEGIEQLIIRHFAKYAGIDIRLLPYSRMDKFGEVVNDFSNTFILEKVQTSGAEGAVGNYFLSNNLNAKMFSSSYPLTIDNVMVVLPRSKYMDAWHSFFNQKTLFPVILVLSAITVFSISAHLMSLFPGQGTDAIRDVLIILGYFLNKCNIRKFKSGVPETIVISCLLFAIIIIPYTIQAYMWSVKTHPMKAWEAKVYEEVTQNYQIIAPSEFKREGIVTNRKECYSRLDCLKIVRDQKDRLYYTILTDSLFESYKWIVADKQCNLGLYKLKEPVNTLFRTVYFRRGSVLLHPFNKFMFRLKSAGIVEQHYKDIIFTEQLKCKPQYVPGGAVPLRQHDFKMPYNLLIGGYCVSATVFACEVLARKK